MTPSIEIRSVNLRVADLERSLAFYRDKLGFFPAGITAKEAKLTAPPSSGLAAGELLLTEDQNAAAAPSNAAGLFHAALLLPSRAALGHWLRIAADAGVHFDGFSDHGVSEAVYLTDPDGNGLEFYADRPREQWPHEKGELAMGTAPIALPDLLAAGASVRADALTGARWGHLHFRVTDLERTTNFYRDHLGLELTQRFGPSARFLARDKYHHHVGLNTWGGVRMPQPRNALGFIEATMAVRDAGEARVLSDPDGLSLKLVPLAV